ENRLRESDAMHQFSKTLHVVALGLWFGSAVFFLLIATGSIFHTFETLSSDVEHRPAWLPPSAPYTYKDDYVDGPREQGSRLAGAAVAPLFGWFFLLQGVCGLLAAATSINWSRMNPAERVHRVRTGLLLAALVSVLIGWPIERKVAALRLPRNQATDAYLQAGASATEAQRSAMQT